MIDQTDHFEQLEEMESPEPEEKDWEYDETDGEIERDALDLLREKEEADMAKQEPTQIVLCDHCKRPMQDGERMFSWQLREVRVIRDSISPVGQFKVETFICCICNRLMTEDYPSMQPHEGPKSPWFGLAKHIMHGKPLAA